VNLKIRKSEKSKKKHEANFYHKNLFVRSDKRIFGVFAIEARSKFDFE